MFALTVYNNRGSSSYVPPPVTPPPSGGGSGTVVTGITEEQLATYLTTNQYVKSSQLPSVTGVTATDVQKLIRSAGLWRRIKIVFPGTGDGLVGNQTDNDWHSTVVFRGIDSILFDPNPPPYDPTPKTWIVQAPSVSLATVMTPWTNVDQAGFEEPAPGGAWCYLINESVSQGVNVFFYGNDTRLGWKYFGTRANGTALDVRMTNDGDVLPVGRAAILTCVRSGVGDDNAIFHYHVL